AHQLGEVAGAQPVARDVVQPDGDPGRGQLGKDVGHDVPPTGVAPGWLPVVVPVITPARSRLACAAATTRSGVNPNCSKSTVCFALAPKCSRPTISPASPTISRQPWPTAASTLTRARTPAGSTCCW